MSRFQSSKEILRSLGPPKLRPDDAARLRAWIGFADRNGSASEEYAAVARFVLGLDKRPPRLSKQFAYGGLRNALATLAHPPVQWSDAWDGRLVDLALAHPAGLEEVIAWVCAASAETPEADVLGVVTAACRARGVKDADLDKAIARRGLSHGHHTSSFEAPTSVTHWLLAELKAGRLLKLMAAASSDEEALTNLAEFAAYRTPKLFRAHHKAFKFKDPLSKGIFDDMVRAWEKELSDGTLPLDDGTTAAPTPAVPVKVKAASRPKKKRVPSKAVDLRTYGGYAIDRYAEAILAAATETLLANAEAMPEKVSEIRFQSSPDALHIQAVTVANEHFEEETFELPMPKTRIPDMPGDLDPVLKPVLRKHRQDLDDPPVSWGDAYGVPDALFYRELLEAASKLADALRAKKLPLRKRVHVAVGDWNGRDENFEAHARRALKKLDPKLRAELPALCFDAPAKRRWLKQLAGL